MGRTLKSVRNLKYGIAYQAVDVVLKFAMRTAMVYSLGDAVVGLNGLFVEVLSMLSLAELGVGSAIIYSLYEPLAQNDVPKLKRLMALYRLAYQIIAGIILAVGLALIPVIHLLVRKVDFDLGYIRLVYVLYLLATSVSYLFSYKSSLFNADQSTYRVTRVNLFMDIFWTSVKIAVLVFARSFIAFLAMDVLMKLTQNVFINREANRAYPYLREKSELPDKAERKVIFSNIGHIFIGKLSGRITSSTDNMLISVMDSTLSVGFYSNYAMIINNARTFMCQVVSATVGGIGNQMTVDLQRCYGTLKRLTFVMFMCSMAVCPPLMGVLSELVGAWLGAERVLPEAVVAVLLFNLMLFALREPLWQFLTVSGQFKKDKNISIIGTVANLVISIVLGLRLGMLGIFIGTTATLVIQYVLKAVLLCKEKLGVSPMDFLGLTGQYIAVETAAAVLCRFLCAKLTLANPWLDVLAGVAVCVPLSLLLGGLVFSRTPEMKYLLGLVRKGRDRLMKRRSKA